MLLAVEVAATTASAAVAVAVELSLNCKCKNQPQQALKCKFYAQYQARRQTKGELSATTFWLQDSPSVPCKSRRILTSIASVNWPTANNTRSKPKY